MLIKVLLKTKQLINVLLRNRKGQAMVEMAIILPIILLILMSTVEMGRIFNAQLIIDNASREGARAAALGNSVTLITQRINAAASTLDGTKLGSPVITSAGQAGDPVTVSLNYQLDIITPLAGSILTNPMILQSSTTMRME